MLKAYLGIVNRFGLTSFLPENEISHQLVAVYSRSDIARHTVCLWAALSDEAANDVRKCMLAGEPYLAFETLATQARDIAPLSDCRQLAPVWNPPPLAK